MEGTDYCDHDILGVDFYRCIPAVARNRHRILRHIMDEMDAPQDSGTGYLHQKREDEKRKQRVMHVRLSLRTVRSSIIWLLIQELLSDCRKAYEEVLFCAACQTIDNAWAALYTLLNRNNYE